MLSDEVREKILARIKSECRLKPTEFGAAARAIRFYAGEYDLELTWGTSPNAREAKIEDAVVREVIAHFSQPGLSLPRVGEVRISAKHIRTSVTPRAVGRVGHRRPGRDRQTGGGKRHK